MQIALEEFGGVRAAFEILDEEVSNVWSTLSRELLPSPAACLFRLLQV